MTALKLGLINQALTAVGEDPVSEITGQNAHTRAAIEHYDAIVGEELERNQPKSAVTTAAPTLLTATVPNEPLPYQWQPPADCLSIIAVLHCNRVLDGDAQTIENGLIRTAYNTDIRVRYARRVSEENWSFAFRAIIEKRLEALFRRVQEQSDVADDMDKKAEQKSLIARHADARQRQNRPMAGGSLVDARLGRCRSGRMFAATFPPVTDS